ncbi:MAG: ribosome recycling factor [Erysipelotrichaceae bacterium]|nr:ribosome recycling factor [Erysipelotrichaceae bacterium]
MDDNLFEEMANDRMDAAIKAFEANLAKVRTGRANPTILDGITVDYYGSPTPLNQIASISIQEGKTLVIKPFDRNSVKDVERAINISDLGLPVQNNGDVLRVTVPALTEETRKGFCKDVDKMIEEAKVQIRNIRREANEEIKKDKTIPEDISKSYLEDIQKLTDKMSDKIEEIGKAKQKEIMTL